MARELKRNTAFAQVPPAQIAALADEIRQKYGPCIGWDELSRLLDDRSCVSFPCRLEFDATPLLPGEFAHCVSNSADPKDGYTIYVHPRYAAQRSQVPYLVLHQLARVNFGEGATADDAETFGSLAFGLTKEAYYQILCDLSGQISGDELV